MVCGYWVIAVGAIGIDDLIGAELRTDLFKKLLLFYNRHMHMIDSYDARGFISGMTR